MNSMDGWTDRVCSEEDWGFGATWMEENWGDLGITNEELWD